MAGASTPARWFEFARAANRISLPARHFAVVDAGNRRGQVVLASVSRGRPKLRGSRTVDTHEEGYASTEELREDVRNVVREVAAEAVILVLPHAMTLRHVLDVPPQDAGQVRLLVEKEATRIGGLSESQWAFDSTRLQPFVPFTNPVAAVFCRQSDLQGVLDGFVDDARAIFEVVPAGDALAAAYRWVRPGIGEAILVDLGALHTGVTILSAGQVVFSSSFPAGSDTFTQALALDRRCSPEAAEVLKRTEPRDPASDDASRARASVVAWLAELEKTIGEWAEDHPAFSTSTAPGGWPVILVGGGAMQPGLIGELQALSSRPFEAWPESSECWVRPDQATAWGALLIATGVSGPAPSFLPSELRGYWRQQRLWRGLLTFNLVLSVILGIAMALCMRDQGRLLEKKRDWREAASGALHHARDIRTVVEGLNAQFDSIRPVLERERQTIETLEVLEVLRQQRTNAMHWYVLLADGASYATGSSNDVATPGAGIRTAELSRVSTTSGGGVVTNLPTAATSSRTFVAEVCFVPQGEEMRRALSDMVADLKRYALFRNVDVLPAERRRDLVATNLVFPERHFALELNLSEAELLPSIPLPRPAVTNREPRLGLRTPPRSDAGVTTNSARGSRLP